MCEREREGVHVYACTSVRKNAGIGLKVSSVSSEALIMISLNIFLFNEHLTRMGRTWNQRLWAAKFSSKTIRSNVRMVSYISE